MHFLRFSVPVLICVTGGSARAGGGAATDAYEGIRSDVPVDLHGLADLYIQSKLNAPHSDLAQLRAFDVWANAPSAGILRLTAAHKPEPFGFRVDLAVGDLPNAYLRSDPATASHPGLSRAFSFVEQAFATATVPVGQGLRIDIGKFETPVGLEDNESLENWNYSRSFLYFLAEPSYHTGLRATYQAAETLALSLYWVNGWDANVLDGNGMRAFAGAVTWNPSPRIEAVADYMGGLEHPPTSPADPALDYRHELDAYVTYKLGGRVSFACTADYGHDASGGGVDWWGVGGYLRYLFSDWLAGALRGEHYGDPDGFTSGARQRLAEITVTAEARARPGPLTLIGRLEYRHDQSDMRVFQTGSSPPLSTRQDTLSASLVAAF